MAWQVASWVGAWLLVAASWALAESPVSTRVISLDGTWLLATDPQNAGRQEEWYRAPRPEAKTARVPWIIQECFPGYHGVAWYWRDFDAPANLPPQARTLLRFWAVDYLAEVWLNGVRVGGHEGGEGPFVLDVTPTIKPGEKNQLAVRVLNPTNEPIDGISLPIIPRRCKVVPFNAGALYNDGGMVDSVELLAVGPVRLAELHVIPDRHTGVIRVQATAQNALPQSTQSLLELALAPAAGGETLRTVRLDRELPPGDSRVEVELPVSQPHLWELNDPYLYRVTARIRTPGSEAFDEQSTRCGFREFRFENGYFRLNGRRVFLKCSHTSTHYPIGLHWPHDPDLARRDLLNVKAMGFNAIRFFCSVPTRYQLELCDEIGLMIYEECYAGWFLQPSPQMVERFDREVSEMIRRDRNHPSVVMWGLLNENSDGPVFRHAVEMLPLVRSFDNTRVVMLNSGRFDNQAGAGLAGISVWNGEIGLEPNVTYNANPAAISTLGVIWGPGQLALHPGPHGEYCTLRFTAPADGEYVLSATFTGIAERATTDVHILSQGQPLFTAYINLREQGNQSSCEKTVALKTGETIDFAVGRGNGQYGGDTTALVATIRSQQALHDAVRDFSIAKNPHGVWSYGFLKAGESPDTASFKVFAKGETVKSSGGIGSLANPGSAAWEDVISDQHPYKRVPHTAPIIRELRTASGGGKPVFISEYGIGSGVDLAKVTRQFEQLGAQDLEDAQWYRQRLEQFLVDWQRWNLADTFASPEDFFAQCLAKMGRQRLLGINAIRANPGTVAHSMTGTVDQANCGEGLFTTFRLLKPGTFDCVFDGWYPLRFCLFAEPVNVYRQTPVRLEAVLANEDRLAPGEYPVRIQVVGPGGFRALERKLTLTIPDPQGGVEPSLALPVFSEEVAIDGPPGQYRLLATFERNAAAAGGEIEFYVADPVESPALPAGVVLWGEDPQLAKWLAERGIRVRPFTPGKQEIRETILAAAVPPAPGGAEAFGELAARIARGSTVVFLSPAVFARGDQPAAWVPLAKKGTLAALPSWLYHKDEWAKQHPVFAGLPAGGLMDYTFYREIIPDAAWAGQETPAEVVAGATNTSIDYSAGLFVSVHSLGAGQFILNTLSLRENLTRNPAADRILVNMLRHAARQAGQPLADLPADFEAQRKALGY